MKLAEGEAKHQKTIDGYEANDKGRGFRGQQGKKACRFAREAVSPTHVLPQILSLEHPVSDAYHCQVQAHEEVRNTEMRHEDAETLAALRSVDNNAVHKASGVADQRHSSKDVEKHAEEVGA